MPFTVSHAAAVLPFVGTGLPASALLIGSLTPDLPYFVPVRFGEIYPPGTVGGPTHTVWALITLDLAIGLLAWLVWHGLLAEPLVELAPHPVRARLSGRVEFGVVRRWGGGRWIGVLLALAVGAAGHVLWDEFTHPGRWGARHVPLLAATWAGWPGVSWAQGVSGVVGGLVLVWWVQRWWRTTPVRPVARGGAARWTWPAVVASWAVVAAAAAARVGAGPGAGFYVATRSGCVVIVVAITVSLLRSGWRLARGPARQ